MGKFSSSVKSYYDIHQAFEAAGQHGGLLLTFETPQKATAFAARANAYRVLLRKQNEGAGREFASEFDHLMVRRIKGTNNVQIEPRGFDFVATTLSGEKLVFDKKTLDGPVPTPYEKTIEANSIEDFLDSFGAPAAKEGKKK